MAFVVPRDNFEATRAPLSSDDLTQGYEAGSRWLDNVLVQIWVCTDGTQGAAVWKRISESLDDLMTSVNGDLLFFVGGDLVHN